MKRSFYKSPRRNTTDDPFETSEHSEVDSE